MPASTLNLGAPVTATLGPITAEAKQGRIILHDARGGPDTHQFPDQFLHRVKAMEDNYKRAVDTAGGYEFLLDDMPARVWRKFFEDAEAVIKLALNQVPIHDRETFHERRKKTMNVAIDLKPMTRTENQNF